MTAFIRHEGLLEDGEIDAIVADVPADLLDFQRVAAAVPLDERPTMGSWLERSNAGRRRAA